MRPRSSLPLLIASLATVAAVTPAVAVPATAHAADALHTVEGRQASCKGGKDFPIEARIHDGPDFYRAGDAFQNWAITLENDAHAECRHIHPVIVLVDKRRKLRAGQVRMEFRHGGRWRHVRMERTDRDETVGVFGGSHGFTVRPDKDLTVRVRLALAAGTAPNDITAQAAVVQRHGDDGDWVGESDDYAFSVVPGGSGFPDTAATPDSPDATDPDATDPDATDPDATDPDGTALAGQGEGQGTGTDTDAGADPSDGAGAAAGTGGTATDPGAYAGDTTGTTTGTGSMDGLTTGDTGFDPAAAGASQVDPGRLARTGSHELRPFGVAAGVLILVGAALVALTGRSRSSRRWGRSL